MSKFRIEIEVTDYSFPLVNPEMTYSQSRLNDVMRDDLRETVYTALRAYGITANIKTVRKASK